MVVNKLVERIEFHHPKEEFSLGVAQDFEVLDTVGTSKNSADHINIVQVLGIFGELTSRYFEAMI